MHNSGARLISLTYGFQAAIALTGYRAATYLGTFPGFAPLESRSTRILQEYRRAAFMRNDCGSGGWYLGMTFHDVATTVKLCGPGRLMGSCMTHDVCDL
jgi:hypothetical protein